MQTDLNIIALFSKHFQVNPVSRWIPDRSLERNMNCLVQQYPGKSEKFWVQYWLKAAINNSDPAAVQHLRAYLESACYWSAKTTYCQFAAPDFTWLDYLQIARELASDPVRIFKNYNATQSLPRVYAQKRLSGAIMDAIRKGKEAERTSDWGLLRTLSKKALKTALQKAGINEPLLSHCLLAWQGFGEIYTPVTVKGRRKLQPPTESEKAAIAQYYNELQFPQNQAHAVSTYDIETWLNICIKAARYSTKLEKVSFDIEGSVSELEIAHKLEEDAKIEAEHAQTQAEWEQTKAILMAAIASLEDNAQKMLILEYGLSNFNQTEIGKVFGIKQYQVSRELKRYQKDILKVVLKSNPNQAGIKVNMALVDQVSQSLEIRLKRLYRETMPVEDFLTKVIMEELRFEIPLLLHCSAQNLVLDRLGSLNGSPRKTIKKLKLYKQRSQLTKVAHIFQSSKAVILGRLVGVQSFLQVRLKLWIKENIELPDSSLNVLDLAVEILVNRFLAEAPYAVWKLEIERRQPHDI